MSQVTEITEILNRPKGASIVYHIGFLAKDRGGDKARTDWQNAIRETGNIAWKLMEKGAVALTQKRLGDGLFEYRATRL